jgi:putative ABC transport system permease protein
MLKNYLTIALRNLRRQKGYAFINIFGLAVGLAACCLILLYVRDELRFDSTHERAEQM